MSRQRRLSLSIGRRKSVDEEVQQSFNVLQAPPALPLKPGEVKYDDLGDTTVFNVKRLVKKEQPPEPEGTTKKKEAYSSHKASLTADIHGILVTPDDPAKGSEEFHRYEAIRYFHVLNQPPVFQFFQDVNGVQNVKFPFLCKDEEEAKLIHDVVLAYVNEKVRLHKLKKETGVQLKAGETTTATGIKVSKRRLSMDGFSLDGFGADGFGAAPMGLGGLDALGEDKEEEEDDD